MRFDNNSLSDILLYFFLPINSQDAYATRACDDFLAGWTGYKWISWWTTEVGCKGKICS